MLGSILGSVAGAAISSLLSPRQKGPTLSGAQVALQDVQGQLARQLPRFINRPYLPFMGPRIAPFSSDQMRAMGLTRMAAGSATPAAMAASPLTLTAAGLNPTMAQQIMSPYMRGVTDEIARLGNENLMENILPEINDRFIQAGQFRSTRNEDFAQRAIRNTQREIQGRQAQALQQGFTDVMNRALAAGQQGFNMGAATRQGLAGVGEAQRGMAQGNLDLAYADFQRQYGFPLDNLSRLMTIANAGAQGAIPNPMPVQQPNRFAQGLGGFITGGQIGSAFDNWYNRRGFGGGSGVDTLGSGGMRDTLGFAEGGRVPSTAYRAGVAARDVAQNPLNYILNSLAMPGEYVFGRPARTIGRGLVDTFREFSRGVRGEVTPEAAVYSDNVNRMLRAANPPRGRTSGGTRIADLLAQDAKIAQGVGVPPRVPEPRLPNINDAPPEMFDDGAPVDEFRPQDLGLPPMRQSVPDRRVDITPMGPMQVDAAPVAAPATAEAPPAGLFDTILASLETPASQFGLGLMATKEPTIGGALEDAQNKLNKWREAQRKTLQDNLQTELTQAKIKEAQTASPVFTWPVVGGQNAIMSDGTVKFIPGEKPEREVARTDPRQEELVKLASKLSEPQVDPITGKVTRTSPAEVQAALRAYKEAVGLAAPAPVAEASPNRVRLRFDAQGNPI